MTRTANELAEFLGCPTGRRRLDATLRRCRARFGTRLGPDLCGDVHAIWSGPPPPAARCVVIRAGPCACRKDTAARGESEAGICARGGMAPASGSDCDGDSPDRCDFAHGTACARRRRGALRGDRGRSENRREGTEIGAFCFVGRGATIGEECRLYPRVTLYAGARLANRVILHSGAVIGSDGFGYVADGGKRWKFPQVGEVEIEDDVEIGANTTIDRGSLDRTEIGAGAKLDNLVHIAHNVRIGENTVIAAQTGISGSAIIGRNVAFGGPGRLGRPLRDRRRRRDRRASRNPTGKIVRSGQIVWGTPGAAFGEVQGAICLVQPLAGAGRTYPKPRKTQ